MRWFTLLLIGCVSVQAAGAVINVPADHTTIQAAIVAANPGDVVIVAPGAYREAINFLGKAITVRSTDPNDRVVVLNTIIDGSTFNELHVVKCVTNEGPDTVLTGFTITGGNANGNGNDLLGGGMFNNGSSPTVTNCSFIGNNAGPPGSQGFGGGMANVNSSPTVTNCSFSGNTTKRHGGGMYNLNSSPTVTNCSFTGNNAVQGGGIGGGGVGGGMANFNSSPTVTNCSFSGNSADLGGGMYNSGGSPTVTNTGFCANTPNQIDGDPITDGGGNSLEFCPPQMIPLPPACPADINTDTNVNVTDLLALLAAWGACP